MAADIECIDQWEDAEVRQKLEELGSPVGPITRSTRKVLVTKLKQLLYQQNASSECGNYHSNYACYSSGEEGHTQDCLTPQSTLTKRRSKRTTSDTFHSPKTSANSCIILGNNSAKKNTVSKTIRFSPTTTTYNFETDSDPEIDVVSYDDNETPPLSSLKRGNHTSFRHGSEKTSIFQDACDKVKTLMCHNDISCVKCSSPQNNNLQKNSGDILEITNRKLKMVSKYQCTKFWDFRQDGLNSSRKSSKFRYVKLIIIILLIIIIYFTLEGNTTDIREFAVFDSYENVYPICGEENVDPSVCIEDKQLMHALDVAHVIIPRVINITISSFCSPLIADDAHRIPVLSDDEALRLLIEKIPTRKSFNLEKDLKNFKILVIHNNHWEIQIIASGVKDIKKILFYGQFAARHASIPLICKLRRIANHIPNIPLIAGIFFCASYFLLLLVRYTKRRRELHQNNVRIIVNNILQLVSSRQKEKNDKPYISIDQFKDMIIPPEEIFKRGGEWEDAVKFVEEQESQIRTEIHCVNGKFVKVWIWEPTTDLSSGGAN